MVNYQHCGLYFTQEQIQQARKYRDREPFRGAWAFLLGQEQTGALASAQWNGLRFRLNDDHDAGQSAAALLQAGLGLDEDDDTTSYFDALAGTLALAQTFELVRDHPAFSSAGQVQWLNRFAVRVNRLNQVPYEITHFEQLWLGAMDVAAGVVLERDDLLEHGTAIYRQAVNDDIRPEGYLPKAVESGDGHGLYRQLLSVEALALMAEAAAHVGVDLWNYSSRGVSVRTAAAYLVFYYYFPEKWKWDAHTGDEVGRIFRQHGGFLEMLNRRGRLKDMKPILDELRPIYDLTGGGLTTLTHGGEARRGLFG